MPAKWEIFYLQPCRHTLPQPKDKFLVIVYIDPLPHGFLVNSRINAFIANRSYLLCCEASILQAQHRFLKYDSYIDCRDIFSFDRSELVNSKGFLSDTAQAEVIKAVQLCPVLETIHKNRI
jgi:hypothetical protein